MNSYTTGPSQFRFTPKPGVVDEVICGVCKTTMNVERDTEMSRSYVAAICGKTELCDCFTCPHAQEEWHRQVVAIRKEIQATASRRLSLMLEQECQAIIANRSATVDMRAKGMV